MSGTALMLHRFSGDPWGPCSLCAHPAYHEIHIEPQSGPGCPRHEGEPHNLCPECWKLEP